MLRKSDLVWLSVAAFAGVSLFHTSYRVQGLRDELAGMERQIGAENDGIQVLKAEWSFLNDPARLEQLAANHLTLKPITATQISGFDALPIRSTAPISVSAPQPVPTTAAPAQVRKAVAEKSVPAVRTNPGPSPAMVTLASVRTGAVPQPSKAAAKPSRPSTGSGLSISHASSHAGVGRLPGRDEIGSLLTRLGRIQ
ncbi:MAG: hypothetical protein WCF85_03430 [Rhodospirillaceae bacterium]